MARLATLARAVVRRRLGRICLYAGLALTLSACAEPRVRSAEPPLQVPPPIAAVPQTAPPPVQTPPPPAITATPLPPVGAGAAAGTKVKVALLLPLSGQYAALGATLQEAAQLALFDAADAQFELVPRDTKGTPAGAVQAAQDAITGGARLILGPVFAPEVAAVKPLARQSSVPVLAFTNDVTAAGNGTYVLGFVPNDQVRRVVGFARSRGLTRLAALAPRNPYGDAVVTALTDAAVAANAQLVRVERYDANSTNPAPAVAAVAAGSSPGVVPFDALLLPEAAAKLKVLAAALPAAGVDPTRVRLLGTGLWDEPGLGRDVGLVGGWYAAPQPTARADFESRYQQTYNRKPQRLATLAYDATALAAVLSRGADPASPALFNDAALTNPNGFAGLDGIFRLRPDGVVERGLAVLEVTADGSRVIDPAPTSFVALSQ